MTLPTIADLKAQAKRLRSVISADGDQALSHSRALELIAGQYGYRDWNTLSAAAGKNGFRAFAVGDRVRGHYLAQAFEGEIIGLAKVGQADTYRVTIQFDTPVDVVTFDSFSAFRSRVSCTIRENGIAVTKTSDGRPHLVMDFAG